MEQTRHLNMNNEIFFKDSKTFQDKLRKLPLRNRSALSHFKTFLNSPTLQARGAVCMSEVKAPNGETFSHIWIELGDKVIDKTTSQQVFDRASYYKISGITTRQVTRYDKKAAEIFVQRNLALGDLSIRPLW